MTVMTDQYLKACQYQPSDRDEYINALKYKINAREARIKELEDAMSWKPISDDAKDLGAILIYEQNDNYPFTAVACWDRQDQCWREAYGDEYATYQPTYFMPLPPAPEQTNDASNGSEEG